MKNTLVMQVGGFVILICLWEGLTVLFQVPEYIFPRFSAIIVEFCKFPGFFLEGFLKTSLESFAGLLLGGIAAYLLAIVFSFSTLLKHLFYQWFVALKTVPIIAISPMIIIWVGSGMVSKILMASIITFFPILVNTLQGFYNITENQLNLFRSCNATYWQIFLRLRIPMSFGYFFTGLKVASPLSTIGAIVAEFSGANAGIGYIILKSSWESNTRALMVAVLLASIMGITLYKIIELSEHLVAKFFPHFNTKSV
ncbi:ABC transporter permease subunit [candidate division KSB3 bacterium]|uniref:ABC transporter permease subunit n=1 Tax=candidate division KSB3 bacterium TaxID=2044937 RepID=A0A9D5Q4B3_9BACT|nr:ABC transporter permease subunit [candidate division KSB3 bacterium]MBD3323068.1 ABC transporter permease subunit [candidate division KSB3 bacterium]